MPRTFLPIFFFPLLVLAVGWLVRYTFIVVDVHLLLLAGVAGASLELAQGRHLRCCSETVCCRGSCRPTQRGDLTPRTGIVRHPSASAILAHLVHDNDHSQRGIP